MIDTELSTFKMLAKCTKSNSYLTIKSFFDIFFAWVILIVTAPLFGLLAIIISLSSPGPIFYKSKRHGKNGMAFKMYKFRTMNVRTEKEIIHERLVVQKDGVLNKTSQDQRISRISRFLRKSSLDELPQIINIALGQMSFIGPRPVMPEMTKNYPLFESTRCLASNQESQDCGKYAIEKVPRTFPTCIIMI